MGKRLRGLFNHRLARIGTDCFQLLICVHLCYLWCLMNKDTGFVVLFNHRLAQIGTEPFLCVRCGAMLLRWFRATAKRFG